MSKNEYDEWCSYCGYPAEHHPIERAKYREKDGMLCEEPVIDD